MLGKVMELEHKLRKYEAIEIFCSYNSVWNVIECKEMNLDEEFGDSQ